MKKFSLNAFRKKGKQKSGDNRNYMPANKTAKEVTQRKFGLRGKSHLVGILTAGSLFGASLTGCETYPAGSPEAYGQEAMFHKLGAAGMRINAGHADTRREAEGYLLGAAAADILAQDSTLKAGFAAGKENAQYIGDSNVQAAGIIAGGMQQTPYLPQRAEPRIYDPEKKQMFLRLDSDRNNLLSWDELGGSHNLQNLDGNSDGWVDDNEFGRANVTNYNGSLRKTPRIFNEDRRKLFLEMDTDGNNLLSPNELGNSYSFQNLDGNSDGWVDDYEFNRVDIVRVQPRTVTFEEQKERLIEAFHYYDKNHDGFLTYDEWPFDSFKSIDKNNSGRHELDEWLGGL